jgi:hypothetical protein
LWISCQAHGLSSATSQRSSVEPPQGPLSMCLAQRVTGQTPPNSARQLPVMQLV